MFSVFAENFEKEIQAAELKGEQKSQMRIAKRMFGKGKSIREVKEFTELPDDTLRELQKQYGIEKDAPER